MHEQKLKNSIIGTNEFNGNIYIETFDENNNIQKELLTNFFLDKKDNIFSSQNFPFKIIKNLETIDMPKEDFNLDIIEIEKNLNKIINNYNYVIEILLKKLQEFKKRNDELIIFAKKIINIYNSSLNSKSITKEILLNTKNILKFNNLNVDDFVQNINSIDFGYNILKFFSIEKYLHEKILIKNNQLNTSIIFKPNIIIKSFIILDHINKILIYTKNEIYLFNLMNYSYITSINTDSPILSLNLIKDNIILVSHENSIKELEIKNNKLILKEYLKEYLKNVSAYSPGQIVNYKDGIAWTNGKFIGLYNEDYFDIDDFLNIEFMTYSGGYNIDVVFLYQYSNDILLYLYIFSGKDHHGFFQPKLRFSLYNKISIKNKKSNYFIDLGYVDFEIKDINFKIIKLKDNKIITFGNELIFIIDVNSMSICNEIYLTKDLSINNFYSLNGNYFIFCLKKAKYYFEYNNRIDGIPEDTEKNSFFIIKLDDNYHKILYGGNLLDVRLRNFVNFKNNLVPQIISIENNRINFYQLIELSKND